MKDTLLTIVVLIGVYIVLPFLLLWAWDRYRFPRRSKNDHRIAAERFQNRLRNPDLDAVAAHYGTYISRALRSLYSNLNELTRTDFDVIPPDGADPIQIFSYNPADDENLHSVWPGCEKFYAFADDGGGNELLVDPTLDDPPIWWHNHETGELEMVAARMSEFMKWERCEHAADQQRTKG